MQQLVHYFLHFIFPGIVCYALFRKNWIKCYIIMLLTMAVDADHLLATPIFDATRCSINFHPLHSYWAIAVYIVLLFFKQTRVIAIGLLLHMITDGIDCLFNKGYL